MVFPAPFGPMSPTSSPVSRDRVNLLTAVNPPNRFVQSWTSSSGMGLSYPKPGCNRGNGSLDKFQGEIVIMEKLSSHISIHRLATAESRRSRTRKSFPGPSMS